MTVLTRQFVTPFVDFFSKNWLEHPPIPPPPETGFLIDELANPIIDELGFAIEYAA